MPKTVPNLPGLEPGTFPFSKVVEANGFVFVAGQVGEAPGGHGAVPGGIEAETRAMLDNVGRLLRAVGLDYARRRQVHRLPARLRRLRGDERCLSDLLPDGAAGQGDGGRDRPGRGLPGRDRGHRRPLVGDREAVDRDVRVAPRADHRDDQAVLAGRRPGLAEDGLRAGRTSAR